jgi:hypothetical protein
MRENFSNRKRFIFFPMIGIGGLFLGSLVVMWLWNAILPGLIVGVSSLTYFKAMGLLLLSRILFGGFRGGFSGRKRPYWKEKMRNMTPEEREKFQTEWRERCGKR